MISNHPGSHWCFDSTKKNMQKQSRCVKTLPLNWLLLAALPCYCSSQSCPKCRPNQSEQYTQTPWHKWQQMLCRWWSKANYFCSIRGVLWTHPSMTHDWLKKKKKGLSFLFSSVKKLLWGGYFQVRRKQQKIEDSDIGYLRRGQRLRCKLDGEKRQINSSLFEQGWRWGLLGCLENQ